MKYTLLLLACAARAQLHVELPANSCATTAPRREAARLERRRRLRARRHRRPAAATRTFAAATPARAWISASVRDTSFARTFATDVDGDPASCAFPEAAFANL